MSVIDLLKNIGIADLLKNGGLLLLVLLTLIQITPIKLNPWSWLAKRIGKAINGEIIRRIETLEKEISTLCTSQHALREETAKQAVVNCRVRILRFGDELTYGVHHSKGSFEQTLKDIDTYERYCREHPNFQNNMTCSTVQLIKDTYNRLLSSGDFS